MPSEFYLLRGDMHPTRRLKVTFQRDGDVMLSILQNGSLIEESDDAERGRKAIIEFCVSGGKHHHVLAVLRMLPEAIAADRAEHPGHDD
jgi:hypothetical protein